MIDPLAVEAGVRPGILYAKGSKMFDETIAVTGGDFANSRVVKHKQNRHTIFQNCPVCGEDVSKIAITKLVYTHTTCECGTPEYRHLIEQLWHKWCFIKHYLDGAEVCNCGNPDPMFSTCQCGGVIV